jgi:hypothetical protein
MGKEVKKMAGKSIISMTALVLVGFLAGCALASPATKPEQSRKEDAELTRQMESIAADFSLYLANNENRAFASTQIKAAPKKYLMAMRDFLAMAADKDREKGGELLFNLAVKVDQAEATMKDFGYPVPRVDIKLPVKAHRKLLKDARAVYVAVIPLEDETEVKSISAYDLKGKRIALSPGKPPAIPTFVIGPAEEESLEPPPPLIKADKPGKEENPERVFDDYVGLPWLLITDTSEGWTCGDPEIYVRIKFYIWNYNQWIFINAKVNLPGVNDAYVWYWLGELGYNSTYRYLSSYSDWKYIVFEFWEEDSGGHGADDFLGSRTINWKSLPYSGYTHLNFAHGDIMVDRD